MKKTLLSLIMLTSIGIYSSKAQITVNDTHLVGAGDNVVQAHDTIPTGVTIGSAGANQTWNFSTVLDDNGLDTLRFRNPTGYPGASSFPSANLVLIDTKEDSTWIYLTKNTLGLFIVGQSQYNNGNLTIIPIAATIISFPSTMGTNYSGPWNGTLFGLDVSGFPLGLDSLKITRGSFTTSNIDGWGNISTPFGSFAALRQIVITESIDTTWEKSTSTGNWTIISPTTIATLGLLGFPVTDISYDTTRTARWWTDDPNSKFPLVEMDYEANGTVNNVDWQKSTPTVGVQEQVKALVSVSLYPNPANNEVTIETSLNNTNYIEILDLTGKLIEKISFNNPKITISVTDYNSGFYFYNIYDVNGSVLHSNKFAVTK